MKNFVLLVFRRKPPQFMQTTSYLHVCSSAYRLLSKRYTATGLAKQS